MGLNARQRQIFDRDQSVGESMKEAVASTKKRAVTPKKKEKWTDRLKRSVKELIGGKNTYMPKNKSVLKEYAKETGKPSYKGASGSDLKELQKKFGKKK